MAKEKKVNVQLKIPHAIHKQLKREALEREITLRAVILEALEKQVKESGK